MRRRKRLILWCGVVLFFFTSNWYFNVFFSDINIIEVVVFSIFSDIISDISHTQLVGAFVQTLRDKR